MNWTVVGEAVAGVLIVTGAAWVLVSALAMFRERDALSRISVMSPATGLGLPSVVAGAFVYKTVEQSFSLIALGKTALIIVALIIVSSVASNTLARATFLSGAKVDPRTSPNELAEAPPPDHGPT